MKMKTLILLVVSLVGTQVWAGNVSIPNTFTDGTTASAGEVNENFNAVKTGVNDNDSRINRNISDITTNENAIAAVVPQVVLKDANDVYVGRVIGMLAPGQTYVLTDKGYRTLIRIPDGKLQLYHTIVFESADCTGAAYIIGRGGYVGAVFSPTTNIDLAYTLGALFYSPKDAQGVSVAHKSSLDADLNCQADVLTEDGWPAFPNDLSITGVMNTAYLTFMQIE